MLTFAKKHTLLTKNDNIGKIIETLKQTKHYENTMIIFTSDHGDQLGDHQGDQLGAQPGDQVGDHFKCFF